MSLLAQLESFVARHAPVRRSFERINTGGPFRAKRGAPAPIETHGKVITVTAKLALIEIGGRAAWVDRSTVQRLDNEALAAGYTGPLIVSAVQLRRAGLRPGPTKEVES